MRQNAVLCGNEFCPLILCSNLHPLLSIYPYFIIHYYTYCSLDKKVKVKRPQGKYF